FLSFPSVSLNSSNRICDLSENDLELIRDAVKQNDRRELQIELRDLLFKVSNRSVDGGEVEFKVKPDLSSYQATNMERRLEYTRYFTILEKQLNNTLDTSPEDLRNNLTASHSNNLQEFASQNLTITPIVSATSKQRLVDKIDLCSFSPNAEELSCSKDDLICPVMLAVPEKGIFVKASSESNICQLFDEVALIQLIIESAIHPVNRAPLTADMIIDKNEC
ncbi:DUF1076 domain-containing protein, partial [Salmonella enterica subsp. enterica serovar Bareilly]|nr:DUF1076 domain-containing protein [Salmonella enterica subsp. enterica serovar Bareilly]